MKTLTKDLQTQGYALLRNAQHTLGDFIALTNRWGIDFLEAHARDPRDQANNTPQDITGSHLGRTPLQGHKSVFLSTGAGSTFPLPLHGELYYQRTSPPELLCFYAQTPAHEKGETLLCDGIALFNALPVFLQTLLIEQKISYTRYSSKATWQKDYATQDSAALISFLSQNNIHGEITQNGELKTVFTTCAAPRVNGEHCFINNLIPFALREHQEPEATRSRVRFEQGESVSPEMLHLILEAANKHQHSISWQKGDILMIDNRWCMHGRDELSAGPRTLYLRMAQYLKEI